jgi:hypothetical protein
MNFVESGVFALRFLLAVLIGIPVILIGLLGGVVVGSAFVCAAIHTTIDSWLASLKDSA